MTTPNRFTQLLATRPWLLADGAISATSAPAEAPPEPGAQRKLGGFGHHLAAPAAWADLICIGATDRDRHQTTAPPICQRAGHRHPLLLPS